MNIFQIQQSLIDLFDSIEEAGGEITPEQEKELAITEEELKSKIKDYSAVIRNLDSDINAIKEEQKRLKELADKKNKLIDKLKSIILEAVNRFGYEKKNGVKYIAYDTGEVSTRKSSVVELNDGCIEDFVDNIHTTFDYLKNNNQLDVIDRLNRDESTMLNLSIDDVNHMKLRVTFDIPAQSVFANNGYNVLKEIVKYTDIYDINSAISKSELKTDLKENGACAPNIARLVTNETIQIK